MNKISFFGLLYCVLSIHYLSFSFFKQLQKFFRIYYFFHVSSYVLKVLNLLKVCGAAERLDFEKAIAFRDKIRMLRG